MKEEHERQIEKYAQQSLSAAIAYRMDTHYNKALKREILMYLKMTYDLGKNALD